jgi:hypothetical protein
MTVNWDEYENWWTLWSDDGRRLARLYKPEWEAKWGARLNLALDAEFVQLDPTLTEDEAKAVVMTLSGARA